MKVIVKLVSNDGSTVFGFAEIDQVAPGVPQALVWKGRAFASQPQYGGGQQTYAEMISQYLRDDAVCLGPVAPE